MIVKKIYTCGMYSLEKEKNEIVGINRALMDEIRHIRYVLLVVNTSRSFPHSRLITGFVTRLTRRLPLMEKKLLTLPEHLRSPPVSTGVRVTRSLVLYACFVDRCLYFWPLCCLFFFDIRILIAHLVSSNSS